MVDLVSAFVSDLFGLIATPASRLFPLYLLVTGLFCLIVYRRRKVATPFFSWLFPKAIYRHRSNLVDLKLFLFSRLLAVIGIANVVAVGSFIAERISRMVPAGDSAEPFHPLIIAAMLLVIADFAVYWVHRLHHESRILWPFHSVHHSAEVMTPLTLYRKHPVYDLLSSLFKAVFIGVLQGGFLVAFDQKPNFAAIAGANLFYVAFHLAGSNLRHSHVWLSFGRRMEHVFISPAQHQIHHSIAPRHHDRNYGEVFALWDWMFGTLYVPDGAEEIEYGLADRTGARLPQRHLGLASALIVPFTESLREVSAILRRSDREPAVREDPTVSAALDIAPLAAEQRAE